jgi:dTDP-4-amino-4,6-dideoxygalactose transaminase
MAPLPPWALVHRPALWLPHPLEAPGSRLYARGRHALLQGVRAAGLGAGDEVLVPAWHHGSEVEALLQAGLSVRFYDIGPDAGPRTAELEALLGRRTRALHLTHFLGWPQDAARWRTWCDGLGLVLIEDAAQAWLARDRSGRPVGARADVEITCLYKTLGLPDGAALRVGTAPPAPRDGGRGLHRAGRLALEGAAQRSARLARLAWDGAGPYDQERDIATGEPTAPSQATRWLLPRLVASDIARRRRDNAAALAGVLGDRVPAPFSAVPAGASPFVLPVVTTDKPALLARLRARGVDAVDLWSRPHPALEGGVGYPGAATRRASTVALPVHQELGPGDLERIAWAMEGAP